MIIRFMTPEDLPQLGEIHAKYYASEFDFPNFNDPHYLPLLSVVDNENNIISAGGVRNILESVIITNKDFSPRDRRAALLEMLQGSIHLARMTHYNQIHAFIRDEAWENQLKKYGFEKCKGNALYLPTGL